MSRRFVHRWLTHWGIWMGVWVIITAAWWVVTRSDIAAGALLVALASHILIAIGWMATR